MIAPRGMGGIIAVAEVEPAPRFTGAGSTPLPIEYVLKLVEHVPLL